MNDQDTKRALREGNFRELPSSGFSAESLARQILDLDSGILSCNLSADPDGAVLAEVAKPSIMGNIRRFSQTGSGMGPSWGLTMINILRRLDVERGKLDYVMVSREKLNALFFPTTTTRKEGENLIVGLLLEKGANSGKIYESVTKLIMGH